MEPINSLGKGLLLLTGCIDPGGMDQTVLQDAAIRRYQYIQAIKFYLANTHLPILFVENSGNNISSEFPKEIESGKIEILTFIGNDFPRHLGKGYGELKILQHAKSHAKAFRSASHFIKITGRHQVLNLNTFSNQVKNNPGIFVFADLRDNMKYADSRLFAADTKFIDNLSHYSSYLNDSIGNTFEKALAKTILSCIIEEKKFQPLAQLPRFSGTSGTTGKTYNQSRFVWSLENIKYKIRFKSFSY